MKIMKSLGTMKEAHSAPCCHVFEAVTRVEPNHKWLALQLQSPFAQLLQSPNSISLPKPHQKPLAPKHAPKKPLLFRSFPPTHRQLLQSHRIKPRRLRCRARTETARRSASRRCVAAPRPTTRRRRTAREGARRADGEGEMQMISVWEERLQSG